MTPVEAVSVALPRHFFAGKEKSSGPRQYISYSMRALNVVSPEPAGA